MEKAMEKRKDPRVSVSLMVIIKKDGKEFVLETANISRGGAFIKTDNPLNIDEVFDISINLSEKIINCKGKVVWVSFPSTKSDYLSGMGVKFIDMTLGDLEYLGKFLGDILKKQIVVDETAIYSLKERIQIFDSYIFDICSDCLVLFVGEEGEFFDIFAKEVFDKADKVTKDLYEINKNNLSSGEACLLPYLSDYYKINYVLLISVPTYFDSFGEELLRKAILNCLQKASEQIFNSLSIPVFSLFETSFPINVVARILLGSIYGFLKKEHFPRKVFVFSTQNDQNIRLMFENKIEEIFS